MKVDELLGRSDELMHYGTPRHSGRYPWGSGDRPFQGDGVGPKPMSEKKKLRTAKSMSRYWNQGEASEARAKTDRTIQTFKSMRNQANEKIESSTKQLKELENKKQKDFEDRADIQDLQRKIKELKKAKTLLDERVKELETPDRYTEETYRNFRDIKQRDRIIKAALLAGITLPIVLMSDEGTSEELYHDDPVGCLVDRADELMHYGTPRHSGRYPWGSGERPFQGDGIPANRLLPAASPPGGGGPPPIPPRKRKPRYETETGERPYVEGSMGTTRTNKKRYRSDPRAKKPYNKGVKFGDEAIKEMLKKASEKDDNKNESNSELSFDERMKLEDKYFSQVDEMGKAMESFYKHARNIKESKKKVKNPAKKMTDAQLKEITERLRLENAYLKQLGESNSYFTRPDRGENVVGLIRDIGKIGTTAGRMYNINNKRLQ